MKNMMMWMVATGFLLLAGCKPKDADIKAAVDTAIATVSGVTAEVKDGVVTLSGTVASEASKTAAETAAKAVKGVKSISNTISVVVPQISGDDVLTTGVKTALAAFADVQAAVKDSIITLTGKVKRADLQKVIEAAQSLRPKKVENQMTIE